jgi:PIN domain nuclease of toxin-antitoxin system
MRLILDAHIVIWLALDDPKLSIDMRETLSNELEPIGCSLAQLWEVEIKIASSRLPALPSFLKALNDFDIGLVPIEPADAIRAAHLPRHHGDPFDRMLIAQAQARQLTIVTHDKIFGSYTVPVIWA